MKLVIGSMLLVFLASIQYKHPPAVVMDPKDAIALVNQLLTAVSPAQPENSYMPPFLKQKLEWLYAQEAAHKLTLKLAADDNGYLGSALMHTVYKDHMPMIEINANQLMVMVRIQEKVQVGFNRTAKDTFAIVLAHEAVHLEKPEQFFSQDVQDPAKRKKIAIAEELRAWKKIDELVVSELLKAHEPVPVGFHNLHAALKNCGNVSPCPAFESFYSQFNLK
jgi:hypothetical protein